MSALSTLFTARPRLVVEINLKSLLWTLLGLAIIGPRAFAQAQPKARIAQRLEWYRPTNGAELKPGKYLLEATAESGLPIRFQVVEGDAQIKGTELTVLNSGTIRVQAEQPGNLDYQWITETRVFQITPEKNTVSLLNDNLWQLLNPFPRPVSTLVTNGVFELFASAPENARLLFNSVAVDLQREFTNCSATLVFSAWENRADDSTSIGLLLRSRIHMDHRRDWYAVYVVPKNYPGAAGSFLSTNAALSIAKVHRLGRPVRLAWKPIRPLNPAKKYRVEFTAEKTRLTGRLFVEGDSQPIETVEATDSDFQRGFPSVMLVDQTGMIGKGNFPVQLKIHEFSVTEK